MDAFSNVSHNITDEDFSIYEANDPFVENFVFNVQNLLGLFKVRTVTMGLFYSRYSMVVFFQTSLTKTNFDLLVKYAGAEIADQLEKAIVKIKYNRVREVLIYLCIYLCVHLFFC